MLESASNADGYLAGMFDRSKVLGKAAFVALGMPTPPHVLVHDREGLPAAAEAVGWPCVLKPVSSGGGRGVTAHLLDLQSLHRAWDHATALERPPMLVEAWVPGEDHRLMVIDGQLVAVIRREASQVVGDGRCTVAELVHRLNATRDDNFSRSNYLRKIPLDEVLQRQLAAQGLSLDRVPDAGRQVRLRSNANLSTGGICIDVTAAVHPHVRQGAETIAQALGIGTAGIDYITTDISRSPAACGGRFIEVNLAPGVDAMIAAGWDPAAVGSLVLGPQVGRIPVRLVLVPGAQLPQALADLMASSPADGVGWACGDRARIGALELSLRAGEGGPDLGTVLRHPQLQHLLVVASTEALLRHGLPLDRFDHVDAVLQAVPEAWHAVLQASAASVQAIGSWDRRQVLAPA
jgi:cyanophycin synthetase